MIRAFQNEKRIATAVVLKDNKILQVYPRKQQFENEDAFKAAYPEHEFKTEDRVASQERSELTRSMRTAQKHIKINSSLPLESDTPLQRLVRQIYSQTGTRDSIRSSATDWNNSYYGSRQDPGIFVQIPESGLISPVHFNRKSGLVLFNKRVQNDSNPEGMRFFVKRQFNLIPITPQFYTQSPGQKAVVYAGRTWWGYENEERLFKELRDAGFHIVYYLGNAFPTKDIIIELYRVIPNLTGVITQYYDGSMYLLPSLENADRISYYNTVRANVAKWITENK